MENLKEYSGSKICRNLVHSKDEKTYFISSIITGTIAWT
jgi:hypothetical protein